MAQTLHVGSNPGYFADIQAAIASFGVFGDLRGTGHNKIIVHSGAYSGDWTTTSLATDSVGYLTIELARNAVVYMILSVNGTNSYGAYINRAYCGFDGVAGTCYVWCALSGVTGAGLFAPIGDNTYAKNFIVPKYDPRDGTTLVTNSAVSVYIGGGLASNCVAEGILVEGVWNRTVRYAATVNQITSVGPNYGVKDCGAVIDSVCITTIGNSDFEDNTSLLHCASGDSTATGTGCLTAITTAEFVDAANHDFSVESGSALYPPAGSSGNYIGWYQGPVTPLMSITVINDDDVLISGTNTMTGVSLDAATGIVLESADTLYSTDQEDLTADFDDGSFTYTQRNAFDFGVPYTDYNHSLQITILNSTDSYTQPVVHNPPDGFQAFPVVASLLDTSESSVAYAIVVIVGEIVDGSQFTLPISYIDVDTLEYEIQWVVDGAGNIIGNIGTIGGTGDTVLTGCQFFDAYDGKIYDFEVTVVAHLTNTDGGGGGEDSVVAHSVPTVTMTDGGGGDSLVTHTGSHGAFVGALDSGGGDESLTAYREQPVGIQDQGGGDELVIVIKAVHTAISSDGGGDVTLTVTNVPDPASLPNNDGGGGGSTMTAYNEKKLVRIIRVIRGRL